MILPSSKSVEIQLTTCTFSEQVTGSSSVRVNNYRFALGTTSLLTLV